jgi:hypothetical protein
MKAYKFRMISILLYIHIACMATGCINKMKGLLGLGLQLNLKSKATNWWGTKIKDSTVKF